MSQTRIHRRYVPDLNNNDWMRELEHDSQQVQAVLSRLDELALRAINSLERGDKIGAAGRMVEIREGLRLVCSLMGVKLQA